MNDKILIIIPIKANSKRVPGKNFRELCGKKLFEYALNAVNNFNIKMKLQLYSNCNYIESYISATENIYDKCFEFIKRPEYLMEDPYQINDVCLWNIEQLEKVNKYFDTLIMVQPTNPFITSQDIENCYRLFVNNKRNSGIRCVKEMNHIWVDHSRFISHYRRTYQSIGTIIVEDIEKFKKNGIWDKYPIPYIMSSERAIDIDTELDFKIAEILMNEQLERNNKELPVEKG